MPTNFTPIGLQAIIDLGTILKDSNTFIDRINKMTDSVLKFAGNSAKSLASSSGEMSKFAQLVERAKSITYGILVADVFRGIARAVSETTQEVGRAVIAFQQLKIQFETLAARDYMRDIRERISSGEDIPLPTMGQALKDTAGQAESLLRWVREIAVTTPFSVEALANVTAMANAYGFTVPEVQRLTLAVGNFTAGMGLSDEVLKRIIYNMGQMVAQGKPTGRELRDLSNSFVPIGYIQERFAIQMGKTKAEIIDMMKTGAITAKQFVNEFIEMVDEDFPNAMGRMSRTFVAAFNNVKDLVQSMVSYEILGPVADEMAGVMQDMVASALTEENYTKAANIGQALLFSFKELREGFQFVSEAMKGFNRLFDDGDKGTMAFARGLLSVTAYMRLFMGSMYNGIRAVTDFVQGIFNYFGTSFSELKNKMQEWGGNIVIALARGMAGAVSAVLKVIMYIGQAITRLLKSNSPPLLLPDLEVWGTNAMMSYMEGWTKADFDIFNDIGDLLSRAISSWGDLVSDDSKVGIIIQMNTALAKLTEEFSNFGRVSTSSIEEFSNSLLFSSEELKKYIDLSFKLANLKSIGEAVSSIFDFEGVGEINIFGSIVDSFDDIIALSDKFGPALSGLIKSWAKDSKDLIAINKLIAETQEQINISTKTYENIIDSLQAKLNKINDRQEDIGRIRIIDRTLAKVILTAYERERLELEKQEILIRRQIRDTQDKQKNEENVLETKLKEYEKEKSDLEKKVELEKKRIKQISDANIGAIEGQLSALKSMIEAQIKLNELLNSEKDALSGIAEELDDLEEELAGLGDWDTDIDFSNIEEELKAVWEEVYAEAYLQWKKITDIFEPVKEVFTGLKDSFKELFDSPENQESWDQFWLTIGSILSTLTTFWDQGGEAILQSFGDLIGGIATHLFLTTDATGKSILQILADGALAISQTLLDRKEDIAFIIDEISEFVNGSVFPALKDFLTALVTTHLPNILNFIITATPILLEMLGFIVDNWRPIVAVLIELKLLGALKSASGSALDGMSTALISIAASLLLIKSIGGIGGLLGLPKTGVPTPGAPTPGVPVPGIPPPIPGIPPALPAIGGAGGAAVGLGAGPITAMVVAGTVLAAIQAAVNILLINALKAVFTGETGTVLAWLDETLGADIGGWMETNLGPGGTIETRISEFLLTLFGEEGIFKTNTNGAFGEDGTITAVWKAFWGEGGTSDQLLFGANERTTASMTSLYGEDGVILGLFKDLFGLDGSLFGVIDGFYGEEGTLNKSLGDSKKNIETHLGEVYGEKGSFVTFIEALLGAGGLLVEQLSGYVKDDSEYKKAIKKVGKGTVDGFKAGLEEERPSIIEYVKQFFLDIIEAVKDLFDENSPSEVFKDIGIQAIKGFQLGMSGSTVASPVYNSSSVTNDNRVVINMNPTYSNVQSESSVYHDVVAAISSMRI